jgi:hypothetical protein
MKTHTTSGIAVTEYDEADTEEIIAVPMDDVAADRWEALADAYASGEACHACGLCERGVHWVTGAPWRECAALDPSDCPVVNPQSLFRRQAS